jgi:WD40 repeat protein
LLAFHLGRLPESEVDRVAEHLEVCPICEAALDHLDTTVDQLLVALRKPGGAGTSGNGGKQSQSQATVKRTDGPDPENPENWPRLPGYDVLDALGRGGMGVVYKARQRSLNRAVALKQLRAGSARELARSRLEAEALARLHHPNIVQIHEVFEHEGRAFLALELVEGGNLGSKLQGKPQTPRESAALVETLAHAIHFAHTHGIVHRDLKPSNILLHTNHALWETWGEQRDDSSLCVFQAVPCVPKVADFGIAKQLAAESGATREGDVLGTPCYMSPEQASGKLEQIGPESDVYRLGVILYEMLTGRVPLQGPTGLDTLLLVRTEEPVSPRRLQPRVPRELETICLKCLRKQPSHRYAGAGELAADLRRFLNHKPIHAHPTPAWERAWKWARRRPAVAALSAAMVLVTTAALVLVTGQWRRAEDKAELARQAELEAIDKQKRAQEAEAHLALQQGNDLCERGEIGRGLLWLARSLERATSAGITSLDRPLRINLAQWGRLLRPPDGAPMHNPAGALALTFDPTDRTLLAGCKDGRVHWWDWAAGEEIGPPLSPPRIQPKVWVGCVRYSPDRRTMATSSNGAVVLWDAATRKLLGAPLPHPLGMIWGMAFTPDGHRLATCSDDGSIRLWDLATRRVVLGPLWHTHDSGYYTLAVHPGGRRLVSAGLDGRIVLWDANTGKPVELPYRHTSSVLKTVFSPDGRKLFTCTRGGALHVFDLTTGHGTDLPAQGGEVDDIALSPDGRLLASGTGLGIVRLWHTASLRSYGTVYRYEVGVSALAFSGDGRRLAIGMENGTTRIVELPPAPEAAPPVSFPSELYTVQYTPDGSRLLAGAKEGALWVDASAGRSLGGWISNPEHFGTDGVTLSPDGKSFAMGRWSGKLGYWGGRAEVWDAATGKRRWQSPDQQGPVGGVAYSPDGRTLVSWGRTDFEGEVSVWDVANGQRVKSLHKGLGDARVRQAVFDPAGRMLLLACNDHRARLWDIAADTEIDPDRPMLHAGSVTACAFDAQGRRILTGCRDGTAQLWDARTRRPLLEPLRHEAEVSAVAFSPDGQILLTGSLDGAARFWDAGSGQPLGPTLWHSDSVRAVAFRPDGKRVATGGKDLAVRQWHTPAPPVEGTPQRIRLWVEVLSGMELDEQGAVHALPSEALEERRRQMEQQGGGSTPSE